MLVLINAFGVVCARSKSEESSFCNMLLKIPEPRGLCSSIFSFTSDELVAFPMILYLLYPNRVLIAVQSCVCPRLWANLATVAGAGTAERFGSFNVLMKIYENQKIPHFFLPTGPSLGILLFWYELKKSVVARNLSFVCHSVEI